MLEMYKLRLRDGTVLVVDHAALSTWLVDGKAMVQPVGSERWLPLRQFLAKEKAEAASAARRNPIPDEIPVARQPPLPSERSLPPVDPPPLPAVVPPPPLPPASAPPVWSSPPPVFASEPPVVWAPAEEITVQPPAADDAVSIAAMPSADEPEAPLFTDVPSPSEPPAPVLSVSEAPEVWAPTEEAAPIDAATAEPPPDDEVEVEVAALPEADEPEAPLFIDAPSPSHPPADLPSISLPPEVWAPTEEAAALYEATAAELYESTARAPAHGDEDGLWRTAAQAMNEARETPASLKPRNLQVLADATVASRARSKPPPSTSRDGLIALRPLDDEGEAARRAAAPPILYEGDEDAERATGLESSFLGLAPPWDARLSRWLDVLSTWVARLGRGLDQLTPRDPASTARAALSRLRSVASLWTDRSSKWMERLTRRNVQAPSPPSEAPRGAGTPSPTLRKPLMPPPPLSELPVLRFAKTDDSEPEGAGDHDVYQGAPSFDVVWLWLKRIALITVLVAGGIVAASTWEAWLPAATQLGRAFFLEIHDREHPRAPSGEEPRPAPVRELLPALAEQLPHLAPETIALVMSRSPATALDGPEVFARAYDATERGLTALSAPEAQELGALQRALLNGLLPAERQRAREYDLLRARRPPLPAENRDVMRSFARAARALPSWARERLQELSGKAIAAALALPSDASPRAATAP